MALLAAVNENGELVEVTACLGTMVFLMGAIAVALKILDNKLAKAGFESTLPHLAASMVGLAASVAILTFALLALNKVSIDSWNDSGALSVKIIAIIALMTAMVAAAVALRKFANDLGTSAITLLAIAASIAILADAVNSLADVEFKDAENTISCVVGLLTGMSVMIFAAKGLKISNGLAVLTVAIALRVALPVIKELADNLTEVAKSLIDSDKNLEYMVTFILGCVGAVAIAAATMKAITPLITAIGNAALEIAVGVLVLTIAANNIEALCTRLDGKKTTQIVLALAGLAAIIIAFVAILSEIKKRSGVLGDTSGLKKLIGVSLVLLSFGATMEMLSSSMKVIAQIYTHGGTALFVNCGALIIAFMTMIALIIKTVGSNKEAKGALAAMTAVIVSMTMMLLALGTLAIFEPQELIAPTASLILVMGLLAVVFSQLARIKKVDTGVVISMVGSLLVLSGSLVLLAEQPVGNVVAAMVGLAVVLGLLAVVIKIISSSSGLGNTKKIGVLLSVCGMLLSVSAALMLIAEMDTDKIAPALLSLAGSVLLLGAVVTGLSFLKKIDASVLIGIGVMSAAIIAVSIAAQVLEGVDPLRFLANMGIIVGALGLLTVIAALATKVPQIGIALGILAAVLVALSAAMVISAVGLQLMAEVVLSLQGADILGVAGGLAALGGAMLLVSVGGVGLGLAALGLLGLSVGLLAIAGVAALAGLALESIANSLVTLSTLDIGTVASGILSLSGALAVISLASIGLSIASIGMMMMSAGIAAIAGAAALASIGLESITNSMTTLATIDIGTIAAGLLKMGGAFAILTTLGIGLPVVAAGMFMLSGAVSVFSGSMSLLSLAVAGLESSASSIMTFFGTILNGVAGFLTRIGSFLAYIPKMLLGGAKVAGPVAQASGDYVGASYIEGFNDGAGYHSPIERLVAFFKQVTGQFTEDTSMANAAGASGQAVGQSWASKLWETIKGIFGKIIDAIKGLFKKIGGIADDLDLDLGLDPSNFDLSTVIPDLTQVTGATDDWNEALEKLQENGLDWESYMPDYEAELEKITGGEEGAAIGATNFGDAMGGAGSAAKETKRELTDMEKTFQNLAESMTNASDGIKNFKSISASNPFEAYEEKEAIDPKNVIDNMKNISKTTSVWMADLNTLWERGVHTNLLKYLEELGIEGRDMVKAFVQMSDEQLQEAQGLFNHNLGYSEDNAEAMLNSMHRKLDQVQQWGHNIKTLIERGLDEGIVKKLTDLGPDSADQVAAFASMTERQLKDANDMFSAAMQISADGAGSIIASFAETGDTAAQEFIQGINDGKYGYIEAGQGMGLAVLNALKESLDEHSPSEETRKVGEYAGQGLNNGMAGTYTQVSRTAYGIAKAVLNDFSITLSYDKLYNLGENAMAGLKAGIENKGAEAVSAAEGIAAKCAEIMAQKWDEHSPSRVMMKFGRFFSEGAAIGIEAGAQNMYNAAAIAAEGTVGAFEDVTSQVNDAIAFNCNPIIVPKLDLSYIRSQMAEINSMFNDGTIGVNGNPQNGGKSSGQKGQQQITFTQNNYSPKALSRTEIYRYTHNQLSMAGGYVL